MVNCLLEVGRVAASCGVIAPALVDLELKLEREEEKQEARRKERQERRKEQREARRKERELKKAVANDAPALRPTNAARERLVAVNIRILY